MIPSSFNSQVIPPEIEEPEDEKCYEIEWTWVSFASPWGPILVPYGVHVEVPCD